MSIAAVAVGPAGHVIEVGQHLRIRHLFDQSLEQRRDVAVIIRIALAEVELRCDSQIPLLCQTAADIADMFMHAENFLDHDNDRQRTVDAARASMERRHVITL